PVRWYHLNPDVPTDSTLGPDVLGDQMTWCVYNDASTGPRDNSDFQPATNPLGIEVRQTTFGFNRQGPRAKGLFIIYKLYNRGTSTIDSMYVSQWCDPDLGGFTDDLVGCDTTRSIGFCYNATNADAVYGTRPPAEGFDFLSGAVNAVGDTLGM